MLFIAATEVRCQEKTRGGLCYEVILGEPEVKATPPKMASSPKNNVSVQDIEEKLRAAEERRQVCVKRLFIYMFYRECKPYCHNKNTHFDAEINIPNKIQWLMSCKL